MGIQDRDYYRNALKEKLKAQEEEEYGWTLPKKMIFRKPWIRNDGKKTIWELLFKTALIFSSFMMMIEVALKAWGKK